MSANETHLLLYLETCAVDHGGRTEPIHMNDEDRAILDTWNTTGFVRTGRIRSGCLRGTWTCWCELSDEAWVAVAAERRARAKRMEHDITERTEFLNQRAEGKR